MQGFPLGSSHGALPEGFDRGQGATGRAFDLAGDPSRWGGSSSVSVAVDASGTFNGQNAGQQFLYCLAPGGACFAWDLSCSWNLTGVRTGEDIVSMFLSVTWGAGSDSGRGLIQIEPAANIRTSQANGIPIAPGSALVLPARFGRSRVIAKNTGAPILIVGSDPSDEENWYPMNSGEMIAIETTGPLYAAGVAGGGALAFIEEFGLPHANGAWSSNTNGLSGAFAAPTPIPANNINVSPLLVVQSRSVIAHVVTLNVTGTIAPRALT